MSCRHRTLQLPIRTCINVIRRLYVGSTESKMQVTECTETTHFSQEGTIAEALQSLHRQ